MKTIVVYSSKTGNTKRLAEAIYEAMPAGTEIAPIEEVEDITAYDRIALGFYVVAGKVDEKAQAALDQLKGKQIGLFATTGLLFLGGKNMGEAREQAEKDNEVLCTYICPGRIAPKVEKMFEKAFPDLMHFVEDARQPEDVQMPFDEYLKEAQDIFEAAFPPAT